MKTKIFAMFAMFIIAIMPMAIADEDMEEKEDDENEDMKETMFAKTNTRGPTVLSTAIAVNSEGPYAGSFDTLIAAVSEYPGIMKTLDRYPRLTVFAPTDDAFAKLGIDENNVGDIPRNELRNILLYHVAKGKFDSEAVQDKSKIRMFNNKRVMQEDGVLTDLAGKEANIIVADVQSKNGFIHVIDNVLIPTEEDNNLVNVAVSVNSDGPYAGSFDTLIAALEETPGIIRVLERSKKLTVFAPTDDAFAKLGLDENNIGDVPRKDLRNILAYHVTYGKLDSEEVLDKNGFRMLNGQRVAQDEGVLTDRKGEESTIIVVDVEADNGYIHVIDSVLMPK